MSEQKSYKITASEFYTLSNTSLPESTEEIKEFLFEVNNSSNERGQNKNQFDKLPNDNIENNEIVNVVDPKFTIEQSVINSIFSSSEKNKDILVQNFQNKEKHNLENPNVINLINLDHELIQSNKKIKIIENAFCANSKLETNIDNLTKNHDNHNANKSDINLITIDKDYVNSSESGSITIIQNVPLLIINHSCCDNESCKLSSDSRTINKLNENQNIEITTLSTSFKNAKEFENFELEDEVEERSLSEADNKSRESDTNQFLNKDLETTLIQNIEDKDQNLELNTETFKRDSDQRLEIKEIYHESVSNRNQESESTHDNSWSITSFHHYEEIAVEEDTENKSSSQESSVHLADNNEVNNSNEILSDTDETEKFNNLKNKIDEMLAKLDKSNQTNITLNKIDENEKTSDESTQDKSVKEEPEKPKESKCKESKDADDSCSSESKKSKNKKKTKCEQNEDDDSDDCPKRKRKVKRDDCSSKERKGSSPSSFNTTRSSDTSKPYSPQGCPKRENISSPLLDNIDRIKNLLTDLILDSPNNRQDNLRKNKCPNQQNDCLPKSSIRFVFPQINIKQSDPVSNLPKTSSSKLPIQCPNSNKKKNCCSQNKKQQAEPVWVLTRVTKHVTRTVRRESVPCPKI